MHFIDSRFEIDNKLLNETTDEIRQTYSIDHWISKIEEVYFE